MNFQTLRNLSKKQKDFLAENFQMDAMESAAKKEMSNATATGSLSDPKTQRKIADARLNLDLCQSRRHHVTAGLQSTFAELKAEYRDLIKQYNKQVESRREAIRKQIEAALKPFFDGNNRALEITLNSTQWPCLFDLSRAGWDGFSPPAKDSETLADEVANFQRHARRYAKKCGLEIGESGEGEA